MMSKNFVSFLATILVACAGPLASAQIVIGSFEGGSTDGWAGQNGTTVGSYTNAQIGATVATVGSSALNVYNGNAAGNFRWSVQLDNNDIPNLAALLTSYPTLKMDVTWVNAEWAPVPNSNWVRWDNIAINSDAGWKQTNDPQINDPVNPAFPGSWSPVDYPGPTNTRTLTYNLNQIGGWGVGNAFTQINLSVNYSPGYGAGVGGSFYVDNIRLVPEPGTIGLAGLALIGCAIRRRNS